MVVVYYGGGFLINGSDEFAPPGALSQTDVGRTIHHTIANDRGGSVSKKNCLLTGDRRHKSRNPIVAKEPPDLRVGIFDPDQITVEWWPLPLPFPGGGVLD